MADTRASRARLVLITLAVLALALANWAIAPKRELFWILDLSLAAAGWRAATLIGDIDAPQRRMFHVLVTCLAVVLVVIAVGADLSGEPGFESMATMLRRIGTSAGLALVAIGCLLPTVMQPDAMRSAPRFLGWSLGTAGIAFVAWVNLVPFVAPLAASVLMTLWSAAFMLAMIRGALLVTAMRGSAAEQSILE
ncbi:MAG: hypothetical protein ABSD74_10590 [Rhizomicrobium sp.]|jgi:hypothetical protein